VQSQTFRLSHLLLSLGLPGHTQSLLVAAFGKFQAQLQAVPPEQPRPYGRPLTSIVRVGAYLFSDRTTELYTPEIDFAGIIHNYTGTTDLEVQEDLSPTKLVKPPSTEFPFKPTLLIDTERDSMPHNQILDMRDALEAVGLVEGEDFRRITIDNRSGHGFEYWDNYDTENPPKLIKDEVIEYLDAVLKP